MDGISPWWLAFAGFIIGGAVGFAVRRARLCTFGALEDAFVGADTRRLRIYGLALAVALAGTQILILLGYLQPGQTTYVPPAVPWFAELFGGLLFGLGMALVGTCAFGSLIRLGSGDLRSLVTVLVFGVAAYATWRGVFALFRINVIESLIIPLQAQDRADLPAVLDPIFHHETRPWLTLAVVSVLVALALKDARLRRAHRLLTGGVVLGLGVAAGWLATAMLSDPFAHPVIPQSLTFVSTVAKALYGFLFDRDSLADFGVGSVFGVVVGAYLAAWRSDEFHWEAYDDPREMKRHLGGAMLMGVGGVMCGGCTIGQGLTAGSLMALAWPLTVLGMVAGARLGIAVLMEGSMVEVIRRLSSTLAVRRRPPALATRIADADASAPRLTTQQESRPSMSRPG